MHIEFLLHAHINKWSHHHEQILEEKVKIVRLYSGNFDESSTSLELMKIDGIK